MTKASAAVLVLDRDRRHLAWLARVVRTVAPAAELAATLPDGLDLDQLDLVVANYDGLDEPTRAHLLAASARDAAGPDLLLVSPVTRDYGLLLPEIEAHRLSNFLAHDPELAPTDLIVTAQKLLRRDIFGLAKYFCWGVDVLRRTLRGSAEIAPTIEAATRLASELEVHPRLIANLATALDELVTNALYNAPVDPAGRPRFAHLPRTTPVCLDPGEEVEVTVCSDGRTLGVAVADGFGALTRERGLDALVRGLRREEPSRRLNQGGAGLGLFMTLDALNHLVLNLAPGRRTEVIGLIDIRGSYRDFVNRGKSFNVFEEPRAAR